MLFSYLISYLIYFGEEYGWRYFLQPILQHRFGKRLGILILGLIWGILHHPLRLFENDTISNGLIYMVGQYLVKNFPRRKRSHYLSTRVFTCPL